MEVKILAVILILWASLMITGTLHAAAEHPFLICKRSDFPQLRQRADREPWATMKADALAAMEKNYDPADPVELHRYIGAATLVYILDQDNAAAHARRVYEAILNLEQVVFDPAKLWAGTVRQMCAAFVSILALDIVYDDLNETDIARCEALIEKKISQIDKTGNWLAARLGTHGTWDIYKGLRTTPDEAFYQNYMRQMTEDGVSTVSPGYAFSRLGTGDTRMQKTGYADVLEFTGIDRRYYNSERLKQFYRWLYSASITPSREFHLFGDVSPAWTSPPQGILFWRVGRFDRKAAGYAAWLLKDKKPAGHFLGYILMTEPLPEPIVPQSRLDMTGAAVFREQADSPLSLGAMLYNINGNDEWHTHEETNGLSLAAYGSRLLANGGWLGEPMCYAERNNTIAINDQRHAKRHGNGLVEGLIGDGLDYACGDSGEALGDGRQFQRSLVMVHGQEAIGGYFVVIDEVKAQANDKINHYLQLASESPIVTVSEKQAYQAVIDHHAKVEGVKLSVFYATKPASIKQELIESGYLERTPQSGHHYRLEAIYPVDENGARQILTLLFPCDAEHPQAEIAALNQPHVSGARVSGRNGVEDWVIASDPTRTAEVGPIRMTAQAAMVRQNRGQTLFYFVRRGTSLRCGNIGFESSRPLSLHMKGKAGIVNSQGAEVALYHPDAQSVRIDGTPTKIMEKGESWIRFSLPAGRHRINID